MGASRMSRMRSASTSARGSGSASDGCGSSPADKEFWTIFGTSSEKPSKSSPERGERSSGKLLARGSTSNLVRRSPLRNCDARTPKGSQFCAECDASGHRPLSYGSFSIRISAARSRNPSGALRLDALHAAVRLRPPQQAEEGLGLGSPERDHITIPVRIPGLPVLDHPQDAVPRLLLHRHELRHLRRGPRILEGPLEHGEASVGDDGDLVRHLVQERAVVAHDEHHAGIGPKGRCDDLLALDVEVVRRLVEDEEVVLLGDELRESEARTFPATELPDAAVDRVSAEPEAAEEAPCPGLRRRRT